MLDSGRIVECCLPRRLGWSARSDLSDGSILEAILPAGTIVATLSTPVGSYFNKFNQSSYIGTSYLLSVCCFTPLYGTCGSVLCPVEPNFLRLGRLSDILGRKGAMLLALSLFSKRSQIRGQNNFHVSPGSGTILCGLASSMKTLIAARAIAGMGGGG
jgi:MFS family permease